LRHKRVRGHAKPRRLHRPAYSGDADVEARGWAPKGWRACARHPATEQRAPLRSRGSPRRRAYVARARGWCRSGRPVGQRCGVSRTPLRAAAVDCAPPHPIPPSRPRLAARRRPASGWSTAVGTRGTRDGRGRRADSRDGRRAAAGSAAAAAAITIGPPLEVRRHGAVHDQTGVVVAAARGSPPPPRHTHPRSRGERHTPGRSVGRATLRSPSHVGLGPGGGKGVHERTRPPPPGARLGALPSWSVWPDTGVSQRIGSRRRRP